MFCFFFFIRKMCLIIQRQSASQNRSNLWFSKHKATINEHDHYGNEKKNKYTSKLAMETRCSIEIRYWINNHCMVIFCVRILSLSVICVCTCHQAQFNFFFFFIFFLSFLRNTFSRLDCEKAIKLILQWFWAAFWFLLYIWSLNKITEKLCRLLSFTTNLIWSFLHYLVEFIDKVFSSGFHLNG